MDLFPELQLAEAFCLEEAIEALQAEIATIRHNFPFASIQTE